MSVCEEGGGERRGEGCEVTFKVTLSACPTGWSSKKKNGEPQRYSREHRKRGRMVNPRDIAGDTEKEEEW